MFWKRKSKKEEALESEVLFLRNMVKELNDKLMALSGDAFSRYAAEKRSNEAFSRPSLDSIIGSKIDGMEANTAQEKKDKEEAIGQIQLLMGGR
jgi:hypothetical protein